MCRVFAQKVFNFAVILQHIHAPDQVISTLQSTDDFIVNG